MRLLVIEDNLLLANSLGDSLGEHYKTDVVHTGKDGLREAKTGIYDLIVLDLDLPDTTGLEICMRLRQSGVYTPILILTATDNPQRKVQLLDAGADDYVTKPFNMAELLARLQAISRRSSPSLSNKLVLGEIDIDLSGRTVGHAGQLIELRKKEFDILEYLVRNRGRTLTRAMISDHISEFGRTTGSNVVDVHIKHLRDKIDRPYHQQIIETVHGVGYRIKA